MKMLIVMPTQTKSLEAIPPGKNYDPSLGIMYISAFLKRKGHDVHCFNMNHHGIQKLPSLFERDKFDVVATGGMFRAIRAYREIFALAKERNRLTKTILGGPAATAHPEFVLKELRPDFLVLGEGEETTASLLDALEGGKPYKEIPGIAFIENDSVVTTGAATPIKDLDGLPWPDREGFEFERYLSEHNYYTTADIGYRNEGRRHCAIIAGRGCPGKCTFCFRTLAGRYRERSIDNVILEIRSLVQNYGVNDLGIIDDVFSVGKARLYEFCRKIRPLCIPWQCQLRVHSVDEELLQNMKDAGCYLVSYGFESASDRVLKSMRKGIRTKDIDRVLGVTRKAKITIQGNFIFGDPAETLETAKETLSFWRRHQNYHINMRNVNPYPGSDLYWGLIKKGAIKNLLHFWENECVDEDGRAINMTSLSPNGERLMRARVFLEESNPSYAKVKGMEKAPDGKYLLTMVCPVCGVESRERFSIRPLLVACPHCYQRSSVSPFDVSDMSPMLRKVKKLGRHLILKIGRVLLNNDRVGISAIRFFLTTKKYFDYFSLLNKSALSLSPEKRPGLSQSVKQRH